MSLLNRTNNQAALEAAVTTLQSRSLTQLAIARFLRNRVAVGASIVLLILVALAVFAPVFELLTGYPMEFQDRDFYSGKPPNWEAQHYLGTDYNGRDILVRTMFGMRISMMVALVAATVALVIGISYGAISGLAGGMVDTIMMRILDLLYSFPANPDRGDCAGVFWPEYHDRVRHHRSGGVAADGPGDPGAGPEPTKCRIH